MSRQVKATAAISSQLSILSLSNIIKPALTRLKYEIKGFVQFHFLLRKLGSDCADVQADVSLRRARTQSCRKCFAPARLSNIRKSLSQWRFDGPNIIRCATHEKEPLWNLQTTQGLTSLRIHAGWSGPSLPAYRVNGYCSIRRRTEKVQIRLHGCSCWLDLWRSHMAQGSFSPVIISFMRAPIA